MTDWFNTPDPSDTPAEDEDLLDQVDAVISALADKLVQNRELTRTEALAFIKQWTPECAIFLSVIWPAARELAGLPRKKSDVGRPKKNSVSFSDPP